MRRAIAVLTRPSIARALGLAVLGLALAACGSRGNDQALLAAIGMAQARMHEADELEDRGDRAAAIESAREVLDVPFPEGAPEREDVRLDAWGRIAELELARGDDAAAERATDEGLREVTRRGYFEARLYIVRGRIHRARAESFRAAGDEASARRESDAALEALERSIDINAEVLGIQREGGSR
jgi:hypothetical protein